MWTLEAISDVPFKKPFFILTGTLGAAFWLLAYLLSLNALYQPLTYAILATALYAGFEKQQNVTKALVVTLVSLGVAYLLFPAYQLLFLLAFTLAAGRMVFAATFRIWKWIACAILFGVSIQIVSVWQQMLFVNQALPQLLVPVLHGLIFGFSSLCSFLPLAMRKDSVLEAHDHYDWNASFDASGFASETKSLYERVHQQLQNADGKVKEELEEYTEKIIHLCFRLQETSTELTNANQAILQQQIIALREKIEKVADPAARVQYEQALANKEKQEEQWQTLQTKEERMRAQIVSYISALENMRFAYANRNLASEAPANESIEFFMDVARVRAEQCF